MSEPTAITTDEAMRLSLRKLVDENAALLLHLAKAESVVRPFAELADAFSHADFAATAVEKYAPAEDGKPLRLITITVGHLRNAKAWLNGERI
jgi:hypothetical protein